ncbi:25944_t:CDS:2, partial [Gigaspora margarita]
DKGDKAWTRRQRMDGSISMDRTINMNGATKHELGNEATKKNQRIEEAIQEQEQQRQANKEQLGSNFLMGIRPTKKN